MDFVVWNKLGWMDGLLSKAVNRLPRIYINKLKFLPFWVFAPPPYFTHDASCIMLNIDWTPLLVNNKVKRNVHQLDSEGFSFASVSKWWSSWKSRHIQVIKLLGVHVSNDLKWAQHIHAISRKGASRLYFLKKLKRAGAGTDDLLHFYCAVIRPVLEYACPVWHSSLTITQSKTLESLQKRAMNIIFPYMDYKLPVVMAHIDTLEERREVLTERFCNCYS